MTETTRTSETPISARHGNLGGATSSDKRQFSQRRRLSNEFVNRSSKECAQNSAMDANFLDRMKINTPTPENVENTSRQENMLSNCFFFVCVFIFMLYVCVCVCVYFFMFFVSVKCCN